MTDHIVELCYSKDGGYTFSDWRAADLGDDGQYSMPVVFRRFGTKRSFAFMWRVSSPYGADAIAASVQITGAAD
jgi:hypothetical protein